MNKKRYMTPTVVISESKLKTYIQEISANGNHVGPDENDPELSKQRDFYEVETTSGFGSNSLWDDLK